MLIMMRLLKSLFLLGCLIFLTHCTRMTADSHLDQQKSNSPFTMPTSAYLAMAKNQTGSERQALELKAAGREIYEGRWHYGLTIIQNAGTMTGDLADEKNVLLAKIDLIRNHPQHTIAKLATIKHPNNLSSFYQMQYHDMLAFAYQAQGALVEAIVERIKLDYFLHTPIAKSNNYRALWLCLTKLSQPEMDTLVAEADKNTVLRGWVDLADISRRPYHNPHKMIEDLEYWQQQYPQHPAQALLPHPLNKAEDLLFAPPKRMALMLPLTGTLSGPGKAIQDGFMAAYQSSDLYPKLSVRVYNTDGANVDQVYQRVLDDGADYIVGPLTKQDVARVARVSHPVPTILLNESPKMSDDMAFQFGLSPTQEARQVAKHARRAGYAKVLIIAPEGEWGTEVSNAFMKQWVASHGQVVEAWYYAPQSDLSAGVRQLLHASESAARVRPTTVVSGSDNSFKRRHDFDVIMLIAYPSIARQIMPLIRYYFASDVPVYATSSVYSGIEDTTKDRDLNGIIFCDMPWVFTHQIGQEHHWTEQLNSYNRLYALGMDSFALSRQLNQLLLFPAIGINNQSGVIYLTKNHKLARILAFGQFRQGKAQILDGTQDSKN